MDGGVAVAKPQEAGQPVAANGNNHVQQNNGAPVNINKINKLKEKRKKKKQKKKERALNKKKEEDKPKESEEETVEIDYIRQEETDILLPSMREFAKVFEHFARPEDLTSENKSKTTDEDEYDVNEEYDASQPTEEGDSSKPMLSKKARKRQKRLSIPLLKQLVRRSEVVEVHDVNSADPYFLVYLKSYRNSVPVPRHWSQKRKYLQGKRGIEKPPFQLPDFIAATGISRLRDAYQAKEDSKKLKQKQREKMQPKMGRVDIDYQVLHDAFFRFQTKPKLSIVGDLYYECKEFEVQLKEKRPGLLSDELKRALGMPEGAPPPWLINMQRYGPPTAYPNLKIPGLNAPIPAGASFGYHPGGWGKPPVNEFNQPLYGDVFGTMAPAPPPDAAAPIERGHWGELEEEVEEPEEEQEEEQEAPAGIEEGEGAAEEPAESEIADGISSVPSGLETPDTIDLRKGKAAEPGEPAADRPLYQVLQQTSASTAGQMFGSSHKYIIGDKKEGSGSKRVDLMKSQKGSDINITLNPSEVEDMDTLSDDLLKKKYEQYIAEKSDENKGEDFSDMVAEQSKKRKAKQQKSDKDKKDKKYKDYKF